MTRDDFYKAIQEAYHMEAEATVIKVPFDDVKEITLEAIFYKRGYSDTKKIDLNECARNFYLAQGISPGEKKRRIEMCGRQAFRVF